MEGATANPDPNPAHRRRLAAAVAAVVLVVGAWTPRAPAGDEATFKAAWERATAARKAAADVGFEWRDMKKMLRTAKKLAAEGEYERAVELAERVRRQGELGVMQAREQETAWKEMVVK